MSAVGAPDPASKSAAKKKKKNKKKPNGSVAAGSAKTESNGGKNEAITEDGEDDDDETEAPETTDQQAEANVKAKSQADSGVPRANGTNQHLARGSRDNEDGDEDNDEEEDDDDDDDDDDEGPKRSQQRRPISSNETSARLDAMQQERDNLRAEVTQLRKSLESLQEKHNDDLEEARNELDQCSKSKEQAETQYRNLLGKVNTIRSQLGERLKEDAAELERAREKIEELETTNSVAKEENKRLQESVTKLNSDIASQSSEIDGLRSRTNLSTSNWAKERDDLISREAYLREEYEVAKQAMQDWEILANEERARREAMEDRVHEIEDQLSSQREAYDRLVDESGTQNSTVDGLQRALRDLQEERKRELRELVEQSQAQLDTLREQTKTAEESAVELKAQLESTQQELERAAPFEREVKEKNLLIGKLRHEAVILNDHLTKALRFLKRGKPEDNVDRQLVTNHVLRFLQLDRSDPKKFQVLQLTAALLGWDEQQREQAGLLRQGSGAMTAGGSLRIPVSPFRRTPSTPALTTEFFPEPSSGGAAAAAASAAGENKDSLAELWSAFLEREAESGSTAGSSRHGSVARDLRSPGGTVTSPPLQPVPASRQVSLASAGLKDSQSAGINK